MQIIAQTAWEQSGGCNTRFRTAVIPAVADAEDVVPIHHFGGKMNIKGFLVTVAIAAVVMASINSASMAEPGMQAEPGRRATADSPDERIKYRLGKLSQRLEIRASQQAAWDRFANSVEMLAERRIQQPGTDADAAAIARYHADRASDFAKKLGVIADATDSLQKVLTEDQRKVFNQAARLAMHGRHEWGRHDHGMEGGNHDACR